MAGGLVWESVNWRSGSDQYRFDIERGGLFATLTAPGRSLTLPMAVWDGLFDALKARRTTKSRSEQQFPARARARWYDGEIAEVADAFKSGRAIGEIASSHNRSAYAIEHQLDKLGLISKAGMYGPGPPPATGTIGRAVGQMDRSNADAPAADEGPVRLALVEDRWELRDDV